MVCQFPSTRLQAGTQPEESWSGVSLKRKTCGFSTEFLFRLKKGGIIGMIRIYKGCLYANKYAYTPNITKPSIQNPPNHTSEISLNHRAMIEPRA
jgi:hypothetical protein